jgi:hypothetical protein
MNKIIFKCGICGLDITDSNYIKYIDTEGINHYYHSRCTNDI